MLLKSHCQFVLRQAAALLVIFGMASAAVAQSNTCCTDRCSSKCSTACSSCPTVGSCCPNPDSLLPNPSPLEMDPSTRPLTMPDPANPNALPNANPPGDSFAFSPLQSSLTTPDQVAVPNMMGNLLRAYRGINFQYLAAGDFAVANSSGTVSFRNTKIAENNSAIPRDRVSFRYNYFKNALTVRGLEQGPDVGPFIGANPAAVDLDAIADVAGESRVARGVGDGSPALLPGVRPAARDYDVHLYTFGFEKTIFDDNTSIEVRIPFADGLDGSQDFTSGVVREDFLFQATPDRTLGTSGAEFQDIQLILKSILAQDSMGRWIVSAGSGLSLPTGPDLHATVVDYSNDDPADPNDLVLADPVLRAQRAAQNFVFDQRIRDFTVYNQTYGLSPFIAMAMQPNQRYFLNGFFQLDLPLNESDWRYRSIDRDLEVVSGLSGGPVGGVQQIESLSGSIRDQILMHIDVGGGYWLYQNPSAPTVTGLASIIELHYTTSLDDADITTVPSTQIRAQPGDPLEARPQIGNLANRVDILDLTLGGHIQLGRRASLAVGAVLPLRNGDDRTFDAEGSIQLNLYR